MGLLRLLFLVMIAALGAFICGVAAIGEVENGTLFSSIQSTPSSTTRMWVPCSLEPIVVNGSTSTAYALACPPVYGSLGNDDDLVTFNNKTANLSKHNDSTATAPVTVTSTLTELTTIRPSAIVETITATETLTEWFTTTETHGSINKTVSYVEIVSYSILSVYTTTFFAPPTPITYTIAHVITSTLSAANDSATLSKSAAHSSRPFYGNSSFTYSGLVPLSLRTSASSVLPIWTDTIGVSRNDTSSVKKTTLSVYPVNNTTPAWGTIITTRNSTSKGTYSSVSSDPSGFTTDGHRHTLNTTTSTNTTSPTTRKTTTGSSTSSVIITPSETPMTTPKSTTSNMRDVDLLIAVVSGFLGLVALVWVYRCIKSKFERRNSLRFRRR